jgi:hypothetical protein
MTSVRTASRAQAVPGSRTQPLSYTIPTEVSPYDDDEKMAPFPEYKENTRPPSRNAYAIPSNGYAIPGSSTFTPAKDDWHSQNNHQNGEVKPTRGRSISNAIKSYTGHVRTAGTHELATELGGALKAPVSPKLVVRKHSTYPQFSA